MTNANIISAIEAFAPTALQESWDNTGMQIGSRLAECTGVLLCVDVTPDIVDEAKKRGCNLIVSHHPLIFKPLCKLCGNTAVEEAVMKAVAAGISVYSSHTATDSAVGGVSYRMAEKLGARPRRVLKPLENRRMRLSVTVSSERADDVRIAMYEVLGRATGLRPDGFSCTSSTDVVTKIAATDAAADPLAAMSETATSTISCVIDRSEADAVTAMLADVLDSDDVHIEVSALENTDPTLGLGILATLDKPMRPSELIAAVKEAFGSPVVRCTGLVTDDELQIRRIAICGGSGSEFAADAMRAGAEAFITSDTRYHDFVDYKDRLLIIDIGHYESEACTKEIFYQIITKKFPNFACYLSEIESNPIKYI